MPTMSEMVLGATDAADTRTGRRVLVVEDEVFIAFDLADMLADLGFADVVVASTYDDAEQALNENAFDIAIFDLNLNGRMSTPLIARSEEAGIHTVIASGYEARTVSTGDISVPRITKPYSLRTLMSVLPDGIAVSPS